MTSISKMQAHKKICSKYLTMWISSVLIGTISMLLVMMKIQNNIPQFRISSTNLKNLKAKCHRERIFKILEISWKFQLSYLTLIIKIKKEVLDLKKKTRETSRKITRGTLGYNNSCRQLKKIA